MHSILKVSAAIALVAALGAVQAQPKVDDTVKQTQKPSSGTMPMPKSAASTPKVDDAVAQTQKPSSGMQPAPKTAASGPKVDDSVKQTQKPGIAADGPEPTNAKKKAHKTMKQPQS